MASKLFALCAFLHLCLPSVTADVPTGEQRWEVQTDGGISGNLGRFSPDGKVLYTGDLSGQVSRYDLNTVVHGSPKREWRYTIKPRSTYCERGVNTKLVFDAAETGVVFGSFIPSGSCTDTHAGGFYKLDAATGKEQWNFQLAGFVWDSSAMALNDTVVYAVASDAYGSGDSYMYAFNYETGEELWHISVLGSEIFFPAFLGTPLVASDGTAFLSSENTAVYAVDKDGNRAADPITVTGTTGSTTKAPLLALDDEQRRLLVTSQDQNGNFKQQAFDTTTGDAKELWSVNADRGDVGYGGDRVAASFASGVVVSFLGTYLFGLDATTGDELWRFHCDGALAADEGNVPPIIDAEGTRVFVACYNNDVTNFTALELASGEEAWSASFDNQYNAQCFAHEVATGLLYCLKASDLHVYDGATGEEQWTASTLGYTPLLDHANGAAKCDGGYHSCTDYGPPAGYAPLRRNK